MTDLVDLDSNGVIGPVTKILNIRSLLNEKGLSELIRLFVSNYSKLTGKCVVFEDILQICLEEPDDNEKLLKSKVFQQLIESADVTLNHLVQENIIPLMVKTYKLKIIPDNPIIENWLALLLQTYMTPKQIETTCNSKNTSNSFDVTKFRTEIGMQLYEECKQKLLTENEFDVMLKNLNNIVEQECRSDVLKYTGKYLQLFSMVENYKDLSESVLSLLDTTFRSKLFNK